MSSDQTLEINQFQQQQHQQNLIDASLQDSTSETPQSLPQSGNDENVNIASVSEGGRELSKNVLYVGNIHRSIPEESIEELFNSLDTQIKSIKLLQDKNKPGFNYAFIEFENPDDADFALQKLDGTSINENPLKITKAFQTQRVKNKETFNLFIGDLSLEVNDEILNEAFSKFPSLAQANVMWDMKSGRSRGYGFVSFTEKSDADEALLSMNGTLLGDRTIRLNWASHRENQRNQYHSNNYPQYNRHHHNNYPAQNNNYYASNNYMNGAMNNMNAMNINAVPNSSNNNMNMMNMINNSNINNQPNQNPVLNNLGINGSMNNGVNVVNPMMTGGSNNNNLMNSMDMVNQSQSQAPVNLNQMNNRPPLPPMMGPPSYDMVLRQTPSWLTVVYLGNLAEFTNQNDLIPLLQNFGYIVNFKLLSDKGCAFVTYDTHERAALAIVQLSGFTINGRPLKCGWGKANKPMNRN